MKRSGPNKGLLSFVSGPLLLALFSLLYTFFFAASQAASQPCGAIFFAVNQANRLPCTVNETRDAELNLGLRARVVSLDKTVVAYEARTPATLLDGKNHP